mmetsp:Transcript_37949/g.82517  ORF Transcript_37949/g.82517 Transcript_37949/m.82517 type:complete len:229 (+) Transcript_37949:358-1044(+)
MFLVPPPSSQMSLVVGIVLIIQLSAISAHNLFLLLLQGRELLQPSQVSSGHRWPDGVVLAQQHWIKRHTLSQSPMFPIHWVVSSALHHAGGCDKHDVVSDLQLTLYHRSSIVHYRMFKEYRRYYDFDGSANADDCLWYALKLGGVHGPIERHEAAHLLRGGQGLVPLGTALPSLVGDPTRRPLDVEIRAKGKVTPYGFLECYRTSCVSDELPYPPPVAVVKRQLGGNP